MEFFGKNQVIIEASICDLLMVESMLGVDTARSYGKKPIQDFHRFSYKNL